MQNEKWHELRKKGIGGSDVAAVLGLSKWKTPLDVYLEKTGEKESTVKSERMDWGNWLEDIIAKKWAEKNNYKIIKSQSRVHPKYDFIRANPDRLIVKEDERGTGILEVKNTERWVFESWQQDGIAMEYYCQIQHYFSVLGKSWGYFAVLVNGNDLQDMPVERDNEFIRMMTEKCLDFWQNHVEKRMPPEPINTDDLKTLYPKIDNEKIIDVNDAVYQIVVDYSRAKAETKKAKEYEEKLKQQIQLLMKDKAVMKHDGKVIATFKQGKPWDKFNKDLFAEEKPKLYEQYLEEQPGRRSFLCKIKTEV